MESPRHAPAATPPAGARHRFRGSRTLLVACLALAALVFVFRRAFLTYAQDSFYQSHFMFLWLLFAAALRRSHGAGVDPTIRLSSGRHRLGLLAIGCSLAAYFVSTRTGSSTVERFALVQAFAAFALLALPRWSIARCLAYASFALLCFGIPYSTYFPLTAFFRATFMPPLVALLRGMGHSFAVDGYGLVFERFRVEVSEDCAGLNQIVLFLGLALLGSLAGRPVARRIALLFGVGMLLAYASNFLRVLAFVLLAEAGHAEFLEPGWRHETTGLLVYAPFVAAYVVLILRTHQPRVVANAIPPQAPASFALAWLVVPFVAIEIAGAPATASPAADAIARIAALDPPAGWRLVDRVASAARESEIYDTPHLVHARFAREADDGATSVELFAYLTSSANHLAVHQVKNCLERPGRRIRQGAPVDVDGRRFFTLEMREAELTTHAYYAFTIDGEERDDSFATSLHVLRRRLLGKAPDVEFIRLFFLGALEAAPPPPELELLRLRAQQFRGRATDR